MFIEVNENNIIEVAKVLNEQLLNEVNFHFTGQVMEGGKIVDKKYVKKDIPISFSKRYDTNMKPTLEVVCLDFSFSIKELDSIETF